MNLEELEKELKEIDKIPNGFKPMEILADSISDRFTDEEIEKISFKLFLSEVYQRRMVAVFLFGKLAPKNKVMLSFMKKNVSKDDNWRVQEILGMAFDNFCKETGYEKALATIKDWLTYSYCNTRRAVSEGLRIWTNRPYFKDNPDVAIRLLSKLKNDESEYVRKSCGNALRDISKKYPEKIVSELCSWQQSKEELQIKKIILKNKKLENYL